MELRSFFSSNISWYLSVILSFVHFCTIFHSFSEMPYLLLANSESSSSLVIGSLSISPVSAVYMVAPRAYISVQGPCLPFFWYCSRGAKPCFNITDRLWDCSAITCLAAPKSKSLMLPSSHSIILSGEMSLWRMLRLWDAIRALDIAWKMLIAWPSVTFCFFR